MNSSYYYAVELDLVCICVFFVVLINLWRTGTKLRIQMLSILTMVIIQCVLDIVTCYMSDMHSGDTLTLQDVCKVNHDLFTLLYSLKSFTNLLVPYAIFYITYNFTADKIASKEAKLVLLSIPFVALSYLTLSSPISGHILFLTFHGEIVHGRFYSLLVGTTGFYSVLGFVNVLKIFSSKMDLFSNITRAPIDEICIYSAATLPFILAPVNLLFNVSIVSPGYAICLLYLMTINLYMRISIDDLTALNNRNELTAYLDNLMNLNEKERSSTFMLFIDVNKFKHINDTYGHNEGDVVLMQLSRLLKATAESFNCFLCRYGGDEFIMIKQHANEEKAVNICKFIDDSVTRLRDLSLAPYELSISTGYVRFDKRFRSPRDFIDAADKLMYETKRSAKKDYTHFNKNAPVKISI